MESKLYLCCFNGEKWIDLSRQFFDLLITNLGISPYNLRVVGYKQHSEAFNSEACLPVNRIKSIIQILIFISLICKMKANIQWMVEQYSYHLPFFVCPLNESFTTNTWRKRIIFFSFVLNIPFLSPPFDIWIVWQYFLPFAYYTYITFIHYLHMEIFGGFCHHSKC